LGGSHGTDFNDRSILRPKHRAYYRSGRPFIKIGPKGAQGSHEIRPIHSAPSLGQSIDIGYLEANPVYHLSPALNSRAMKRYHQNVPEKVRGRFIGLYYVVASTYLSGNLEA